MTDAEITKGIVKAEISKSASMCNTTSLYNKHVLAVEEARMWKQRYMELANEKATQLNDIESSLLVLEARLRAERADIERKFEKQTIVIEEQRHKLDKLRSTNQKLLTALMALSKQSENWKKISIEKPVIREDFQPKKSYKKDLELVKRHHDSLEISSSCDELVPERPKPHRSKSFPLNQYTPTPHSETLATF